MFEAVFTQAARAELIEAQDWYEERSPGLGRRFRHEIDVVVERMIANPRQFPVVFQNVRRALARRFPYSIFFVIEGAMLVVIACFHGSRDPLQKRNRV